MQLQPSVAAINQLAHSKNHKSKTIGPWNLHAKLVIHREERPTTRLSGYKGISWIQQTRAWKVYKDVQARIRFFFNTCARALGGCISLKDLNPMIGCEWRPEINCNALPKSHSSGGAEIVEAFTKYGGFGFAWRFSPVFI